MLATGAPLQQMTAEAMAIPVIDSCRGVETRSRSSAARPERTVKERESGKSVEGKDDIEGRQICAEWEFFFWRLKEVEERKKRDLKGRKI